MHYQRSIILIIIVHTLVSTGMKERRDMKHEKEDPIRSWRTALRQYYSILQHQVWIAMRGLHMANVYKFQNNRRGVALDLRTNKPYDEVSESTGTLKTESCVLNLNGYTAQSGRLLIT